MSSTKVSIGSDPELVMLDQNEKIIRASDVIQRAEDKFGLDGHPYIAELRPTPAIHPRDLVASIKNVLASRVVDLQNWTWKAGPWVCERPLGGHIHFGVPFEDHMKDALDNQFGTILALAEPAEAAAQRRTVVFYGDKPYGLLGDIRTKDWGFEYRTPSSFIVTPGTTLGLITIAKAIIWEELEGGSQAFSKLPLETRTQMGFKPEDFHHCKREVFLPKLELLRNQLFKMRYFEKGEEGGDLWPAVSYLLKQVVEKGGYTSKGDIKIRWKLIFDAKPPVKIGPQIFWRDLVTQHHNWWLHNPLEEHQENFLVQSPIAFNIPTNGTTTQETWQWGNRADPETIWQGLGL